MTSLAAQIIDQQVSGIVERHADLLAGELRLGNDEQKMRSAAFVFFTARTAFDLTDREAFDGIVDGADDFGVDALYFAPPENGELPIVLMQGKYRSDLRGGAAFPENGIAKMIDAAGVLFDPERPVTLNRRLTVVAVLLLGTAESHRRNAPDDAPDFLAYGSRFVAMLMGRSLLEELGVALAGLDHRNFTQARQLIERHGDRYLSRAENQIDAALGALFGGRARTLQRLAAAFRRADLVDLLVTGAEHRR